MEKQLINIILLGTAFMILSTAQQTTNMLAQSVLEGVKNETDFHGSGYISQAILHICFAIVNVFTPIVISLVGPTVSMFLGATIYFLYVASYIYPMTWSYYTVAVLMGFGAAFLWNAQGVYLSINSDDSTISRNSGIFWAIFQISLLPGNIYTYLTLKTEIIDRTTRYSLFSIFSIIIVISLVLFIFLICRSCMEQRQNDKIKKTSLTNVIQTLKISGQLLKTRNMLLLLILFAYLGLSPGFFVAIYSTCIGHYKKYGDTRKRLIGLYGICVGLGEVLGGGLFGFITKPKTSSQRAFISFIGFVLQIIFCYFVFINIPLDASFKETDTKPYVDFSSTTSKVITFTGSFILGLGDSGLNTQLMSVLSSRYKESASSAFSIFKSVQASAYAVTLFYADYLRLEWQILVTVIFLFFGTLAFLFVLFDDRAKEVPASFIIQENNNENAPV